MNNELIELQQDEIVAVAGGFGWDGPVCGTVPRPFPFPWPPVIDTRVIITLPGGYKG